MQASEIPAHTKMMAQMGIWMGGNSFWRHALTYHCCEGKAWFNLGLGAPCQSNLALPETEDRVFDAMADETGRETIAA